MICVYTNHSAMVSGSIEASTEPSLSVMSSSSACMCHGRGRAISAHVSNVPDYEERVTSCALLEESKEMRIFIKE